MKKRIFLIGGFSKTKFLAISLINKGYLVTAINNNAANCEALASIEKLDVFNGDGSMPSVLEEANIYGADIAIALTDFDEYNLVISQLCKKRFHVKKTVAVIADPKKTKFFYRMGIDSVVCAVAAVSGIIEQQAFMDEMATLVPLGSGQISMVQVHISHKSPSVGKELWELSLPEDVIIGCIMRDGRYVIPRGSTRIQAGDQLVLICMAEHESAAIYELTGR